ncbi:MAG: ligase-associated DNA damage response exonuclease [Paracoccaceae bacterium]
MGTSPVLTVTPQGLFCPAGPFYIDPWRPVDRALITHAHADHARPGHARYLCAGPTAPVLKHRLGDITVETMEFGEAQTIGGARVSFHPAGHVPGSAQIRVEVKGEVWVFSGDYKTEPDGLCEPFEPVRCHCFITESTFGLPVFRWRPQGDVAADLNAWWRTSVGAGKTPMLGAYSLGKAQRLLAMLDQGIGPILTHGAVEGTTEVLRQQGYGLPDTVPVTPDTALTEHPNAIVLAPPSALGSTWARRFGPVSTGFASGWMQLRGIRRRRAADRGFVLSDHADWDGLNTAIRETGAERVLVTHGYSEIFVRWLREQGYDAGVLETEFSGETLDTDEAES